MLCIPRYAVVLAVVLAMLAIHASQCYAYTIHVCTSRCKEIHPCARSRSSYHSSSKPKERK